jgi:hypothetical protein
MNKKQLILAASMLFAATSLSYSQSFFPKLGKLTQAQKDRIEKVYAASLESGNRGVVESVLAVATMIKLDMPAEDMPILKEKITHLADYSKTPSIRYKASLALAVFENPEKYKMDNVRQIEYSAQIFSALDGTLEQPALSSK